MKILSAEEIRLADAYTIEHEPVSSVNLMERAAKECVKWIINSSISKDKREVKIFCGLGNNGGDGLAIARLLSVKKINVAVFIIRYSQKCSDDFLINEKRLNKIKKVRIQNISSSEQIEALALDNSSSSLIIDSLFGSGLNKPVDGLTKEVIDRINLSGCDILSIDIPSGLFCDRNELNKNTSVIHANHTLTFQQPKLSLLFPKSGLYTESFSILDIGLDQSFIALLSSKKYFITHADVKRILKIRNKFSHKGIFGHALIIAGSYGKMGACVLSSRACLASGSGLVTAHIPKCGYEILQTSNPEVMVSVDTDEHAIYNIIDIEKYDAIGIGPGIGTDQQTQGVLKVLIQNSKRPLVLDADALNILSENKTWISFLPQHSILTPHPGEFKRLVTAEENNFDGLQQQKEFSIKYKVFVVLKGAFTCITCPDGEVYFNSTGNPGMATAGSGDVLTGILTGLLTQGYNPKHACILGVYLHGLSGDLAAHQLSEESLLARNIIEFLGGAFKLLREH